MRIHLGDYFSRSLGSIGVSIDVKAPLYSATTAKVVDEANLVVTGAVGDSVFGEHDGGLPRLSKIIGTQSAERLFADLRRYNSNVFYAAYDHIRCGRIYFDATHPDDDPGCDLYRITGAQRFQAITLTSSKDLLHFVQAERVLGDVDWLPSADELKISVSQGKLKAKGIQISHTVMRSLINWSQRPVDPPRHSLSLRHTEPSEMDFRHDYALELLQRFKSRVRPDANTISFLIDAGLIVRESV